MSDEFKLNHFIPRFQIAYWKDEALPHDSVHVYDIAKRRTYRSGGKGQKAYSFAIVEDLYVPTVDGRRAVGLERWFGGLEAALSNFVRRSHAGELPASRAELAELPKVMMALVGLTCRSPHDVMMIEKALREDPDLARRVQEEPTAPEGLVRENIINFVTETVAALQPVELVIMLAPAEEPWVLSDRPYVDDARLQHRFVVLSDRVVVAFGRSSNVLRMQVSQTPVMLAREINELIVLNARSWLVAKSSAQLERWTALFDEERYREACRSGSLELRPVAHLRAGWRITR